MEYFFSKTLNISFNEAVKQMASMQAITNPALGNIALEVTNKLKKVTDNL